MNWTELSGIARTSGAGRTIGLGLLLLIVAAIRIPILSVPLERDEGEYAYVGQLILQGVAPYAEAANMKMPGIYYIYALIMSLFGQTITGIHLGLIVVNILTAILLFYIARKFMGEWASGAAAAAFAVMSADPSLLGLSANAEHFVLLPVLGGILLLLRDDRRLWSIVLGGALIGTGFIIKQHGAPLLLFGVCLLLLRWVFDRRNDGIKGTAKDILVYGLGAFSPFLSVCLLMAEQGVFHEFWFWTFGYARHYVSQIGLWDGFLAFRFTSLSILSSLPATFALAGGGLVRLLDPRMNKRVKIFVLTFLIFSFLCVCPGFYFRQHYFILLLPVVALLCGMAVDGLANVGWTGKTRPGKAVLSAAVIFLLASPILSKWQYFFSLSPEEISRATYGANPFPESIPIADYLRRHTSEYDRIAILGSEPQIYFYARRRSAAKYMYTYALMEKHPFASTMQQTMIREIEAARPKFIVFVNIETSWLAKPYSDRGILSWFSAYQEKNYRIIGYADILSSNSTAYIWGPDARSSGPRSRHWVAIFERTREGTIPGVLNK